MYFRAPRVLLSAKPSDRVRAATRPRARRPAHCDGRVAGRARDGAERRRGRLLGPVNVAAARARCSSRTCRRAMPRSAIRAAVSAAQEERDELALLLEHARDLSNQMGIGAGTPARWPLPIDELEGELWFEVDRFTESRDAYLRATKLKADAERLDRPRPRQRQARRHRHRLPRLHLGGISTESADRRELEISLYRLKCKCRRSDPPSSAGTEVPDSLYNGLMRGMTRHRPSSRS